MTSNREGREGVGERLRKAGKIKKAGMKEIIIQT